MKRSSIIKAIIVAVGSELLTPSRTDTNSLFITDELNAIGVDVVSKIIVGDNRKELATVVGEALARADILVVTGGLGPTDDDVTREVVADVLGLTLRERPEIMDHIQKKFSTRGWTMPEINRRQAMVPDGAEVIQNPNGTAPGLWIKDGKKPTLLLPGPPRELKPMFIQFAREKLCAMSGGEPLVRRIVRIAGLPESHAEELLRPLYLEWEQSTPPVTVTILAALGQIELHLSARASQRSVAIEVIDEAVKRVTSVLGNDVYSTDGLKLEAIVGELLVQRGFRIAVAESCTGGLISSRLTDVPGSSRYVDQGIVSYSNEAKSSLLAVPEVLISSKGAVSSSVALAMAQGIRIRAGVHVGVGVTGIAGPDGGSVAKPVGTVAFAVVLPDRSETRVAQFVGERALVKSQASQAALDMIRRLLLGLPSVSENNSKFSLTDQTN
tara:strand:+ start:3772 stop:5091 length:1320 start_codon:yes stop_codon:yes gene_type:complete